VVTRHEENEPWLESYGCQHRIQQFLSGGLIFARFTAESQIPAENDEIYLG
jgi:hypothetical protein